ncbi:hypothetical protein CFY87_06595 [Actinobacillus seminis]|uniref:Lipoprotein n=1 Tax=Actinobacillus seminis TaxID=722 RepID=A0A263HDH3_9PAST|nr:hypothetical protein [Actinobacillus seminis]OZN24988.1 hypothetical protein CFY87_06595 [Actinobacillus seminis]SUU36290.1 Uncharacterised protein [Actinobacillus seminis]
MKKAVLALAAVSSLGLAACSVNKVEDNSYTGEILFSAYEGNNLKLTIRKNNCNGLDGQIDTFTFTQPYDSDLVVGTCVRVSQHEQGVVVDNISRSKSRIWASRSGQ